MGFVRSESIDQRARQIHYGGWGVLSRGKNNYRRDIGAAFQDNQSGRAADCQEGGGSTLQVLSIHTRSSSQQNPTARRSPSLHLKRCRTSAGS
jgi:hypothetical protein